MISEVDIRDWEKVDFPGVKGIVYGIMETQWGVSNSLLDFIETMELIRDKQIEAYNKQTAALLRK
jgi:hypothetical protein